MDPNVSTDRSTALLLVALTAMPIVLVSGTALVVDIGSTADTGRVVPGVASVLFGALAGTALLRVVKVATESMRVLAVAAARFVAIDLGWPMVTDRPTMFALVAVDVPIAVRRQPLVRRGPPLFVR